MTHDRESVVCESLRRGAARLATWTKDGTLVSLAEFAQAWGIGARDLEAAVERGDLFEVWVNDSPYIPAELIALGAEKSAEICHLLEGQSASSKLIFLKRTHGALDGKTLVEAVHAGAPWDLICRLAQESVLN